METLSRDRGRGVKRREVPLRQRAAALKGERCHCVSVPLKLTGPATGTALVPARWWPSAPWQTSQTKTPILGHLHAPLRPTPAYVTPTCPAGNLGGPQNTVYKSFRECESQSSPEPRCRLTGPGVPRNTEPLEGNKGDSRTPQSGTGAEHSHPLSVLPGTACYIWM